jgi:hypothetical protein
MNTLQSTSIEGATAEIKAVSLGMGGRVHGILDCAAISNNNAAATKVHVLLTGADQSTLFSQAICTCIYDTYIGSNWVQYIDPYGRKGGRGGEREPLCTSS